MYDLVWLRMTFLASAPAPAKATPAVPPTPSATETAAEIALIDAVLLASNLTLPLVVWKSAASSAPFTSLMNVSTKVAISSCAIEAAIEMATPAVPPNAAAMAAEPAMALMVEVSLAVNVALATWMLVTNPASAPVVVSKTYERTFMPI